MAEDLFSRGLCLPSGTAMTGGIRGLEVEKMGRLEGEKISG